MSDDREFHLGPYVILDKIAEGGLSNVYVGLKDNHVYAVKCLKPERVSDPVAMESFVREARILSALHHPNILPIVDEGQIGKWLYVVTPLVLGVTVAELMERYKTENITFPLSLALYLLRECCSTFRYLHHQSIFEYSTSFLFHGDFSPDNVLVTNDGTIRLVDFGSSGQASAAELTRKHFAKLFYMPPEILQRNSPNPQTDLYSLAILAFYFLSGRRPFEKTTYVELSQAILHSPIPRMDFSFLVSTRNDENALRIFFNKALHKDLKLRFANIEAFEQQLSRIRFVEAALIDPSTVIQHLPKELTNRFSHMSQEWTNRAKAWKGHLTKPFQKRSLLDLLSKRRHPRIAPSTPIYADMIDPRERFKTRTHIRQISRGGMLVPAEGLPATIGKEFLISLSLDDSGPPIRGTAKLLYEITIQSRKHMGFSFEKLSPFALKTLDDFVQSHLPPPCNALEQSKDSDDPSFLDHYVLSITDLENEFAGNIQHGGMQVTSTRNLDPGEPVCVRMHLPQSSRHVLLKGKVVFSKKLSENNYSLSLELDAPPEQIKGLLGLADETRS